MPGTVALQIVGTSVEGRAIEAYARVPLGESTAMVFGGFHGDEPKGVSIARRLIELLESTRQYDEQYGWIVIPVINPDGYAQRKRCNARAVDINRNFPTRNWQRTMRRSRMFGGDSPGSEPETRAVMGAVTRYSPARVVSIHSIGEGRHCNNFDGPGGDTAALMARFNGYPVTSSIGYPTPGSFGTWAGVEREIPTITLELPSQHSTKRCWAENRDALLALVLEGQATR